MGQMKALGQQKKESFHMYIYIYISTYIYIIYIYIYIFEKIFPWVEDLGGLV